MSAEALFFSEISKLKRRIVISAFIRMLLNASLIFLCICLFAFIIQKAGFSKLSYSVSWHILSVGFSFVAALLLGFMKRKKFINILIDIDRRLSLQDRISTAYEYYKFRKKNGRQDVYSQKFEQLRNKLKDKSLTQDQLFSTLHRFLKDIQGEQTRLATELGAKLNAAKIEEMSFHAIPNLDNLSLSKLEKLKMLLNKTLNNKIPDAINQNIETLQELNSMEKLLSQILDDFNEGRPYSEAFAESKPSETRGSQYTNDLKRPSNDAERSQTNRKFSSTKRGRGDPTDQADSNQLLENGRDVQDELGRPEGTFSSAGRAKSTGKKKASDKLEKFPAPGIQDKMMSSPLEHYLMHIRSLTAIGESRSQEEDIIRSYRQEIEGILQKEDIPLNYREYIKHYFISIGLEAEKNSDGLK